MCEENFRTAPVLMKLIATAATVFPIGVFYVYHSLMWSFIPFEYRHFHMSSVLICFYFVCLITTSAIYFPSLTSYFAYDTILSRVAFMHVIDIDIEHCSCGMTVSSRHFMCGCELEQTHAPLLPSDSQQRRGFAR